MQIWVSQQGSIKCMTQQCLTLMKKTTLLWPSSIVSVLNIYSWRFVWAQLDQWVNLVPLSYLLQVAPQRSMKQSQECEPLSKHKKLELQTFRIAMTPTWVPYSPTQITALTRNTWYDKLAWTSIGPAGIEYKIFCFALLHGNNLYKLIMGAVWFFRRIHPLPQPLERGKFMFLASSPSMLCAHHPWRHCYYSSGLRTQHKDVIGITSSSYQRMP